MSLNTLRRGRPFMPPAIEDHPREVVVDTSHDGTLISLYVDRVFRGSATLRNDGQFDLWDEDKTSGPFGPAKTLGIAKEWLKALGWACDREPT